MQFITKKSRGIGLFICKNAVLDDGDFSAGDAFAGEGAEAASRVFDDAIAVSMDSKVAADFGADTTSFSHTNLADNDLADFDFLTTEELNAEALAG